MVWRHKKGALCRGGSLLFVVDVHASRSIYNAIEFDRFSLI